MQFSRTPHLTLGCLSAGCQSSLKFCVTPTSSKRKKCLRSLNFGKSGSRAELKKLRILKLKAILSILGLYMLENIMRDFTLQ